MKRFLLSVVVTATALVWVTTAQAAEPRGESRGNHIDSSYHTRYGTKFNQGFYYPGREHRHWSSCYFDERFGCYLYHCPSTQVYYYWCERDVCYFPINHCPYGNYGYGKDCMWKSCPVVCPKNPPTCPPRPGDWHGTHPLPTQGKPVKITDLPLKDVVHKVDIHPTGPTAPPVHGAPPMRRK